MMWSSSAVGVPTKSLWETLLRCPTLFNSYPFFFTSLGQCHCLYFAYHQSFVTINYRELNQRVHGTHCSSNSVQTVADGVRLKSRLAPRSSQLLFFFNSVFFYLKMAATTQRIVGQFTQSAKDICAYKRTHIAAVTGKPPSFKVLGDRVEMWDCTQCSWLRKSGCTSGKHWDAAQQGSVPHLFQSSCWVWKLQDYVYTEQMLT